MRRETIIGELTTGLGEAAGFTTLDWALAAFRDRLGIEAWPGTVNVTVRSAEDRAAWERVKGLPGIVLPPPRPDWCSSRCYHARIDDRLAAAIVLPEVESYPEDKIELIAAVAVREALDLRDGDLLRIVVETA